MTNMDMVNDILKWLKTQGVEDICLCPGGRNSPFVEYFTHTANFRVHSSFDERSAGFFALGLAQKNQSPVAIITTSGTAVAEVFPSVMEAHYAGIPLVVISADRPRRLRGTGAPQAVEQVNLFGSYVENCIDLEKEFVAPKWSQQRPFHINVCFDEPLLEGEVKSFIAPAPTSKLPMALRQRSTAGFVDVTRETLQTNFQRFLSGKKNPLLLVGTLTPVEASRARTFLEAWPGPIYCEGTSGLREMNHERQLISGDRILMRAFQDKKIDAVVRLGGVPTARLWRSLEGGEMPVFSFSSRPFSGLSRSEFFHGDLINLAPLVEIIRTLKPPVSDLYALDREQKNKWSELLARHPRSEPALMGALTQHIPASAHVYIGNSLPIREWDVFAQRQNPFHIIANRGANGIDGQLSTALAFLSPEKPLWVVLGDLTTLYDSNALWFWQKNPQLLKLVVINNKGGQIFSRMYVSPLFRNSHALHFGSWAEQWSLPHVTVNEAKEWTAKSTNESCLIEVLPSEEQTLAFWQEFDLLWK